MNDLITSNTGDLGYIESIKKTVIFFTIFSIHDLANGFYQSKILLGGVFYGKRTFRVFEIAIWFENCLSNSHINKDNVLNNLLEA